MITERGAARTLAGRWGSAPDRSRQDPFAHKCAHGGVRVSGQIATGSTVWPPRRQARSVRRHRAGMSASPCTAPAGAPRPQWTFPHQGSVGLAGETAVLAHPLGHARATRFPDCSPHHRPDGVAHVEGARLVPADIAAAGHGVPSPVVPVFRQGVQHSTATSESSVSCVAVPHTGMGPISPRPSGNSAPNPREGNPGPLPQAPPPSGPSSIPWPAPHGRLLLAHPSFAHWTQQNPGVHPSDQMGSSGAPIRTATHGR